MAKASGTKYYDPQAYSRFANLNLVARSVVEGYISGLHRSPLHGYSIEFAEYREYVPGDDLKHFDWKVFARNDKRYVKQYQEETNLVCNILLDASGSMAYASKGMSKFDYGCFLAAALSYLMVRQRDSVGLVLFDDAVRERVLPRSSPAHLKRILDALQSSKPSGRTGMAGTLHAVANTIKRRGLIVLISDLYDDTDAVMKALRHFRHDKHEMIVFNLFDPAELEFPFDGLVSFRDLETGERMQVMPRAIREAYLKQVEDFTAKLKRECSASRIDYQFVNTSMPYEFMLAAYLSRRTLAAR
ncbi:MAG TPA: DUF58 domain-containing protein [Candidatus Brocadiia bacterium]|nr:DUF58 domain-containing protein [Candidatus Brocadiia bacterium]